MTHFAHFLFIFPGCASTQRVFGEGRSLNEFDDGSVGIVPAKPVNLTSGAMYPQFPV